MELPTGCSAVTSKRDPPVLDAVVFFYALPHNRPSPGSLPVYAGTQETLAGKTVALELGAPGPGESRKPVFYALPPESVNADTSSDALVPLYEYKQRKDGRLLYVPEEFAPGEGWERANTVLCRVWRSPISNPPRESLSRH